MRVTFLGTGTSHGVPMVGCRCDTCRSDDPRDRRWRPSIHVALDEGRTGVLVDTTPDLRAQALAFGIERVDAVLYTHSHADHVFGLDELRRFNVMQRGAIPLYADPDTMADLRRMFAYVFEPAPERGGGVPQLVPFTLHGEFCLGRTVVVPVPVMHGARPVLGFRIGRFAYLTDCSGIPDASWPLLAGVEVLVIDALRHRPHPTHFTVAQAIDVAARVGSSRALFTHICHDLPHAATSRSLPAGVELAYDGQVLEVGAA